MPIVLEAARTEYRKLEKPINEADFRPCLGGGRRPVTINLHIERLVLDGLPIEPRQGRLVKAAVERDLVRRLTEDAGAASLGGSRALATLDAGSNRSAGHPGSGRPRRRDRRRRPRRPGSVAMSTRSPSSRREAGASPAPGRGARLQRRCACGNHAAGGGTCAACARREAARGEPLTIGAAHDALEQDANRAAAQATGPASSGVSGAPRRPARSSGALAGDAGPAPAIVHDTIAAAGQPLEPGLRHQMEHRLGHDFSGVRVHTDAMAARSAAAVDSLAYTVGRDVVFGAGQYAPHSAAGRELAAHELAHVAQQDGGASAGVVRRQVPRPAPVDADAQRIIDLAADTTTTTEAEGAGRSSRRSSTSTSPATPPRSRASPSTDRCPGCTTTYHGTGAATTGTIEVGEDFVTGTTQRHFARRVIQVGHEIEHVDQVRSGMAGEARSDEREFIAHYHGAIRTELPGTGKVQHSTRVQMIDGALGYYYCLSADLRKNNASKRDELITRRATEVRRSGHNNLGAAPTTCTRAPGDNGPRAAGGGGLSGGAIAGIVLGGIAGVAAIGLGIAALAGAFS